FILIVEVSGDEGERFLVHFNFDEQHAAALGLALILEHSMNGVLDRKSRQDSNAILAALKVEIRRERILHSRHRSQLGDLVFPFRSLYAAIDLLQTDQIRPFAIDHVSDALQVQLLVHANADMNVVSHYAETRLCESRSSTESD